MSGISTKGLPCARCKRTGRPKQALPDPQGSVDWFCRTGNPSCFAKVVEQRGHQ